MLLYRKFDDNYKSMNSRTRKLIGYGLTSAIIAGGGAEAITVATPNTLPNSISSETDTEIHSAFEQNVAYWVARGLGAIATTKLVEVSGGNTYTCPGAPGSAEPTDEVLTPRSPSEVCLATQTVIMTAADLTTAPGGVTFTVGHEVGHVVGEVTNQLAAYDWSNPYPKRDVATEESATCYAGIEMESKLPSKINDVTSSMIKDASTDAIHGTGAEQAKAFLEGTKNDSIATCAISHFLAQK